MLKKSSLHHLFALAFTVLVALGTTIAGCTLEPLGPPKAAPGSVLVVAPKSVDPLVERLVEDTAAYLTRIVGVEATVARVSAAPPAAVDELAAAQGAGLVFVIQAHDISEDFVDAASVKNLKNDGFRLLTADRGHWPNGLATGQGATFLLSAGSTKLGMQYAAYEGLRRLGTRFYHPEEEYVPTLPPTVVRDRAKTPTVIARNSAGDVYEPDFIHRSYSFHGSHPLEHQESFSDPDFPIDEAEHVNEWVIKNFGDTGRGAGRGVVSAEKREIRAQELAALHEELGLKSSTGITLHNTQQGGQPDVDPTSPVPVQEQIERLVEEKLASQPDAIHFGIHFGPTELTTTPDEETVQWINWAGRRAKELRPDLPVLINNHTTGSQPMPNYDDLGCPSGTNADGRIDYYDLAFHTDPDLGVKVHTVMFYPLEGAAAVYNQQTFAHKLCLMEKASAEGRPLSWFPEGSWWLSFDNTIPVYLPLYIWTRARDIELVRPMLATRGTGTVFEHRMFNSGHEWGYWQQDYAVGLSGWNVDITFEQILGELADPFCDPGAWPADCPARQEVIDVMTELIAHQKELFLDLEDHKDLPGGLFTYFSGEDPGDEIAAATGFAFRPVRPSFESVLEMNDLEASGLEGWDLERLKEAEELHEAWLDRLEEIVSDVPTASRPWLNEIIDGIEINMLRARHTRLLYETVLRARVADKATATARLDEASLALAAAEAVIRRREQAYRYPPEQTHGGGVTPETAVPNGTTYGFRVHTKTHLLSYWTNRQERASKVVAGEIGGTTTLEMSPVFDAPGVDVSISWPEGDVSATLSLGDGTTIDEGVTSHSYGNAVGAWIVAGMMSVGGTELPISGVLARTNERAHSDPSSLVLIEPNSEVAAGVVGDLAPGFQWAFVSVDEGADENVLVFAPEAGDGEPSFADAVVAPIAMINGATYVSDPVDFALPVEGGAGGETIPLRIQDAIVTVDRSSGAIAGVVTVDGQLVVSDIVDALIALAGFDKAGALDTIAGILLFDPNDPPATVPFSASFPLE